MYIRNETRSYAIKLIPVIFITAILSFIGFMIMEGDKKNLVRGDMIQTSFIFGPTSLLVGSLVIASFRRPFLVDLLTPVMLFGFFIMLLLVNTTGICGDVTGGMRR